MHPAKTIPNRSLEGAASVGEQALGYKLIDLSQRLLIDTDPAPTLRQRIDERIPQDTSRECWAGAPDQLLRCA